MHTDDKRQPQHQDKHDGKNYDTQHGTAGRHNQGRESKENSSGNQGKENK